jgi:hypothetical protein
MIAFEKFLIENGFKMTHGKSGGFNTYDNVNRRWEDNNKNVCHVGLWAKPTRIGIVYPMIYLKGEKKPLTTIPTEEKFNEILSIIKKDYLYLTP